jgi:DNA processing protein
MGQLFDQDASNSPSDAHIRLALTPGVGPKMYRTLVERFGSAAQVFAAAPSILRDVPGVGPKLARAIVAAEHDPTISDKLERWQNNGVQLLLPDQPTYPPSLLEIPDPPNLLFMRGQYQPSDRLAIGIVGTRHCTNYGMNMTKRLVTGLVQAGYVIVSGLALGIDAVAHQTALNCNGRTLGILGGGVSRIYPSEHEQLARDVIEHGALMSETEPDSAPFKGSFPQRNRIISGLSLGVVVIEASLNSGALITARHAMEQGREVFAVPGRADMEHSRGCHRLIRDGVKLVENVDDILEELGPLSAPVQLPSGQTIQAPAELNLNEIEQQVLACITAEAIGIDQVLAQCGLPSGQALATISVLEMKKLVRRVSGQLVQRR